MNYFLDVDGSGDVTIWRENPDRPEYPEPVVRQCDVHAEAWTLLMVGMEHERDLAEDRARCEAARWPEQHRDDCAWCRHETSLYGRCADCGMTWGEQARRFRTSPGGQS